MEFKKCGICGKKFPKTTEYFYKKGKYIDYRCKKCVKEISNNYRSQVLRGELPKPKHKIKCAICGGEFEAKSRRRVYCSNQCKRVGINRRMDKEFNERYKGYKVVYRGEKIITYKCLVCSSEYTLSKGKLSTKRADGSKGPICWHCIEVAKEKKLMVDREKAKERAKERAAKRAQERAKERAKQLFMKEEKHKVWKIYSNHRYYLKCEVCGKMFFHYTGRKKTCSERCSRKRQWKRTALSRDKRIRLNGDIDWSISLTKLIERDGGVCHICGKQCNGNDFYINDKGHYVHGDRYPSIDHVVPISKGGTHTWDNVKLAHRLCNSLKCDSEHYTYSEHYTDKKELII